MWILSRQGIKRPSDRKGILRNVHSEQGHAFQHGLSKGSIFANAITFDWNNLSMDPQRHQQYETRDKCENGNSTHDSYPLTK